MTWVHTGRLQVFQSRGFLFTPSEKKANRGNPMLWWRRQFGRTSSTYWSAAGQTRCDGQCWEWTPGMYNIVQSFKCRKEIAWLNISECLGSLGKAETKLTSSTLVATHVNCNKLLWLNIGCKVRCEYVCKGMFEEAISQVVFSTMRYHWFELDQVDFFDDKLLHTKDDNILGYTLGRLLTMNI